MAELDSTVAQPYHPQIGMGNGDSVVGVNVACWGGAWSNIGAGQGWLGTRKRNRRNDLD